MTEESTKRNDAADEEFQNTTDREKMFIAVKRALVLTLLVMLLHKYQHYIMNIRRSSSNGQLSNHIFVYVFVLMVLAFFVIAKFTPVISKNVMYGVGWGVGAAMLNKIVAYNK